MRVDAERELWNVRKEVLPSIQNYWDWKFALACLISLPSFFFLFFFVFFLWSLAEEAIFSDLPQ